MKTLLLLTVLSISTSALADVEIGQRRNDELKWAKSNWQRTNPKFSAIRVHVDKLRESSKDDLVEYYREKRRAFDRNPTDHELLFACTYSLFFCNKEEDWAKDLKLFEKSFDKLKVPVDAEVARVRFFIHEWVMRGFEDRELAKRLVRKFKDDTTQYLGAVVIGRSPSIDDDYKSLEIADALIKKDPNMPRYHYLRGGSCYNIYRKTKDRSFGIKSRDSYAKYLELGGESHAWYERGKYWHKTVSDFLKKDGVIVNTN